jgi:hypothetical protein
MGGHLDGSHKTAIIRNKGTIEIEFMARRQTRPTKWTRQMEERTHTVPVPIATVLMERTHLLRYTPRLVVGDMECFFWIDDTTTANNNNNSSNDLHGCRLDWIVVPNWRNRIDTHLIGFGGFLFAFGLFWTIQYCTNGHFLDYKVFPHQYLERDFEILGFGARFGVQS